MNIEQRKQQMQDILKDTVSYYRDDPQGRRAVDSSGDCLYTTWDGKHCAVGRYIKPEYQNETWGSNNESVNQLSTNTDNGDWNIDWCLIDKAQGLDTNFWIRLQDMHDTIGYWEEWNEHEDGRRKYGFTDRGKEEYVQFQDKIAEGEYDNG